MKRAPKKRKVLQVPVDSQQYKAVCQAAKLKGVTPTAWSRMTIIDRATADLLRAGYSAQNRVGTLPTLSE